VEATACLNPELHKIVWEDVIAAGFCEKNRLVLFLSFIFVKKNGEVVFHCTRLDRQINQSRVTISWSTIYIGSRSKSF